MRTKTIGMVLVLVLAGCSGGTDTTATAPAPEATPAPAPEPAPSPTGEVQPATHVASVGAPAPDFTLTDQDGTEHRLSQYRGRVVVLEWINPGCPYVQRHYDAGTMTRLEAELPDDQVVWLAIDSSNFVQPEDSRAWRAQHRIAHPILQDPSGDVGRRYAARTTPHMFVIDREGTVRYAGAIDDDPRGRSEAPVNHVGQAVRALLEGQAPAVTSTEPYGCTVKYEGV